MQRIEVKNFGPIKDINLEIKDYMVFIGPQASGKSTLAKLIYFFWKVEDGFREKTIPSYAVNKILNREHKPEEYIENWKVDFRKLFSEIFPTHRHGEIIFTYNEQSSITFNVDSYGNRSGDDIVFSPRIISEISKLNDEIEEFSNLGDFVLKQKELLNSILTMISNKFFSNNTNLKARPFTLQREFIPSGRSILSILSNSITLVDGNNLDYFNESFIKFTNKIRKFLNSSEYASYLGDIKPSYLTILNDPQKGNYYSNAIKLSYQILKGEFRAGDNMDGIRHYYNDSSVSVIPLRYASSGQQEAAWLVNTIQYLVLNSDEIIFDVIIEEPETHLFPNAQRYITNLITLLSNYSKGRVIVTTHSPYVLATLNNSIKAFSVAQMENKSDEVNAILEKEFWVNPENLFVGFMQKDENEDAYGIQDIFDSELGLIKHEVLDNVSDDIIKQFDELLDIQYSE